MRRTTLTIAVALLIVLAGCSGAYSGADAGDDSTTVDDTDGLDDQTDDENASGSAGAETGGDAGTGDGELEIHHIDVGQADSTLLVTPAGETILVDTGDWRQSGDEVIAYLEDHDIDRIDHLVATHAHADHIGGHAAVIEHFETEGDGVGAAYDSGVAHTSQTYENYLDAIEAHDVPLFDVQEGDELPIDDPAVTATVLNPPEGDSSTDLHFNSVTIVLEFGEFQYLTTGDAETDAESRLVDDWSEEIEAEVYQAGHHGSSTSSSPEFLEAVDPEIAVISSGYESQYGHPHDEVLERFADRDIETYWTAVHGDVVLRTDGESLEVETSESFSTDAADLLEEAADDESEASHADSMGEETTAAVVSPDMVASASTKARVPLK